MTDTELLLDPTAGKRLYAPVDLKNASRMIANLSRSGNSVYQFEGEWKIAPACFDRPVRTLAMQLARIRQFDKQRKAK